MTTFTKTPIRTRWTLGEHLRRTRLAHGLSLDEVSATLLIQKKHLDRLENSAFAAFREEVYLEHILKAYSTYLGFEWEEIRAHYLAEKRLFYPSVALFEGERVVATEIRSSHFWVTSRIVRNTVCGAAACLVFGYLVFAGYHMVRPPNLLIVSPTNNALSAVDTIQVVGRTEKSARILINGEEVSKGEGGVFHQVIGLHDGVNVITVLASKKFGNTHSETRTVIFSDDSFSDIKEQTGLRVFKY